MIVRILSCGSWGSEARQVFSHLASHLSFGLGIQKPKILVEMYGKLNIALVRCNARALLTGGSLTALVKDRPDSSPDARPIAVGETLRCLVGKCLCLVTKSKVADFFDPLQFEVACSSGAEKVIHGLRNCMDKHWNTEDFVVLKVDMRNAFNVVSRQAVLDECSVHLPELLPWVSEAGVQQGDPLGPLLFCLVLQKVVSAIAADSVCSELLFHAWYLDNGVVSGPRLAVENALSIIQELGPPLGLFVNPTKFELFTPSSLVADALSLYSDDIRQCFTECTSPQTMLGNRPNLASVPAPGLNLQLDPSEFQAGIKWWLGIDFSQSANCPFCPSHCLDPLGHHVNTGVMWSPATTGYETYSWSPAGELALVPELKQEVALKWWLGLDTSGGSQCSLCPGSVLDHLSHHAVTCKRGGDVVTRHNRLRDCIVEVCRRAHIGVQVEVGNNLTPSHSKTRPADMLIPNWVMGRTAALDVSVTSPLNPETLLEAGVTATAAALTTEERKHDENDPKCSELGWVCIPVVAESCGAWGREATLLFSTIASRIATLSNKPKSVTLIDIYGRLNLQLVRANATSILARLMPPSY
ncbi:hypothetical protein EMCRGX_G017764 [Ephydatia muelleri]